MGRAVPESMAIRIEAAAEAIAERGFENTRVEDLAAAARLGKTTLYYYFAGKEDILGWLLQRLLDAVADAVADAADSTGSARRRLERVVLAQLRAMAGHPAACRALIANLGRAAGLPEIAAGVANAFHHPVSAILADGVADASLDPGPDLEAATTVVFGAVTITGLHYLLAPGTLDPEAAAEAVLRVVLRGLGPRPGRRPASSPRSR